MNGYLAGIVSSQRAATAVRPRPAVRFEGRRGDGDSGFDIEIDRTAGGEGDDVGAVEGAGAGQVPTPGHTRGPAGDAGRDDRPRGIRPVAATVVPKVPASVPGGPRAAARSGTPAATGGVAEMVPAPPPPSAAARATSMESHAEDESGRRAARPPAARPGADEGPPPTPPRPPARQPVGFAEAAGGPALVAPRPPAGIRRGGESAASSAAANRGQAPGTGAAPEPVVHVTIGRIEIRATSAAAAPGPREPSRRPGVMSLDDYVAQRGSGR